MAKSLITNQGGQLRSAVGPQAVDAFRLRSLIVALNFYAKTGMQVTRHFNAIQYAKRETGLKTRDIAKLIAAVQAKLNAALDQCEIREEQ